MKKSWSHLSANVEARQAKAEAEGLRKKEKHALDHIADLQRQLGVALGISRRRNPSAVSIIKATGAKTESAAVVGAGCWHVEETVRPESVNGVNEYNLDIAKARIEAFFRQIVHQTDIQRHGTDIPVLVLALLGDLLTGFIHEELVQSNSLSPTQTVNWLADRVIAGIKHLVDHGNFKRIVIPCNYGNHGRTTIKPRVSTGYSNSYEWLLFQIIRKYFSESQDGNAKTVVEFQIAESYLLYVQIYGFTLRTHHGDAIKYGGGVGGITIPVNKAISQWDKAIRADIDLFAHWHQFKTDNKWVSTGSMIGRNAYSVHIKADPEPAQQAYFLINKKHGRTVTLPILLQHHA